MISIEHLGFWCLKTGTVKRSFAAHRAGVWGIQSGPGDRICTAGDEAVKIWDSTPAFSSVSRPFAVARNSLTCLYTSPGHAGGLMCISAPRHRVASP